ncbi:MAG: EamA family transporter [archaeon]
MGNVLLIIGLAFLTLIGSSGAYLLKRGADKLHLSPLGIITNMHLIGGLLVYVLTTIVYIIILKFVDLSILYPLSSITYIWTSIISVRFFGERMNRFKWGGVALIILGVLLTSLS